jgi:F-type H+-transporting ATPase subunit c
MIRKISVYSIVELIHYSAIALLVIVPAGCVAFGQSSVVYTTLDKMEAQPGARGALLSCMLLGIFLNEAAALLPVIMGFALLGGAPSVIAWPHVIAELGIVLALGVPALLVGYVSSFPHKMAISSVARQPFQAGRINYLVLFLLSMMQMSVILGLIIAFFMRFSISETLELAQGWRVFAMGLAFGLSSLGPLIGMQRFSTAVCESLGIAPDAYGSLVSFSLISQALIETPVLFALFITLLILFRGGSPMAAIAAALAMGLSTIGPGIASGTIAREACASIGRHPEKAALFSYTSILAQTLVDASVVYGVVIAVMLLFVG